MHIRVTVCYVAQHAIFIVQTLILFQKKVLLLIILQETRNPNLCCVLCFLYYCQTLPSNFIHQYLVDALLHNHDMHNHHIKDLSAAFL